MPGHGKRNRRRQPAEPSGGAMDEAAQRGRGGGRGGRGRGGSGDGRGRGEWRGRGRGQGRGAWLGGRPNGNNGDAQQHQVGADGAPLPPADIRLGPLTGLAAADGVHIMERLSDASFLASFERLTNGRTLDRKWMELVLRVLAKLCAVEYTPLVLRVFCRACPREFLDQLLLHVVQLDDDASERGAERLPGFFRDLCALCHGLVRLAPRLACDRLEPLLKKAALELMLLPHFDGKEDAAEDLDLIKAKVAELKERLAPSADGARGGGRGRRGRVYRSRTFPHDDQPPPDDFREIAIYPVAEDIVDPGEPYLRRVLPRGAYRGVDDYLDVHFRLLREDFVRPLREGVDEYRVKKAEAELLLLKGGTKRPPRIRVQNIRVYEEVQFVDLLSEGDSIGVEVLFDPYNLLARVNWEFSRRLIKGSLLVLSRDLSFSAVVLATAWPGKREVQKLEEGRLFVELCEGGVSEDLFTGTFFMVECINFFGPYMNTLQALKGFGPMSFPLKEYIVDGANARMMPDYLQTAVAQGKALFLPVGESMALLRDVSKLDQWPSAAELSLDHSQYAALQGALTNKVMLIQGPPGTGKTFLGLKVATTLLKNTNLWTSSEQPRPMLVVCSTNHALDQFVMGLLPATNSIVRVGPPCREEKLKPYDIFELRKENLPGRSNLFKMIRTYRDNFQKLKAVHERVRDCHALLREDCGLLGAEVLLAFGAIAEPEAEFFRQLPIGQWLLGPMWHPMLATDFVEQLFSPDLLDWTCLDGVNVTGLRRGVFLALSLKMLQERIVALEVEQEVETANALRGLLNLVQLQLSRAETRPQGMEVQMPELADMPMMERWRRYRSWRDELLAELGVLAEEISLKYTEGAAQVQECRMVQDQAIMATRQVIGMSTSYAALKHRILKQLKPRIVIVEEAAEVWEASVLVSLAPEVEHLVMIGDHQQLRPKTAVTDLAKEYHLDLSLFERMVNNGVHCVTLNTQHRMRPEVASLISPHIYPNLLNHESVYHYPSIRGVTVDVFFVDHQFPEEEPKFLQDANTFQNSHEAAFASALARHFLLQGYEPSQITLLTTYKGQLFYLTKELRPREEHLKGLRLTTVDEYQGEENDIIILSLVRSNEFGNVGYCGIENRVCVALSRAKHGFFIVGNMATLTQRSTAVWDAVSKELQRQGAVGAALTLRCETHGKLTPVATAADFNACPLGGCDRLCDAALPSCAHRCPQLCHIQDQEHRKHKCMQRCGRVVCGLGHLCPTLCHLPCPPCAVPKKVPLACGHEVTMPCHRDPEEHKCEVRVTVVLPACGHSLQAKCSERDNPAVLRCRQPCSDRLDCGHACQLQCHKLEDPEHLEYKCRRPCEQLSLDCSQNHRCRRKCFEECEECEIQVTKPLPCGHHQSMQCKEQPRAEQCTGKCARTLRCGHKCKKKCRDPCEPCNVKVEKTLPFCGHRQSVACHLDPAQFTDCDAPCQRRLPCGHQCSLLCREKCLECKCPEPVAFRGVAACGHRIMVPCSSNLGPASRELLSRCEEPCGRELDCGHKCAGSCGKCMQGRLHQACAAKCERVLICGHVCTEPCSVACPPCKQPCQVKCAHSKCPKRCGEICAGCKEKCLRRCGHQQCGRRCGQRCEVQPCARPCTRVIRKCGHVCVSLCGEPCVCRECSDIDVFFGTEDDEDARFVQLADCKHVFEVTGLDYWMRGGGATRDEDHNEGQGGDQDIAMKVCPRCKTTVSTGLRYSDVIKENAADVAAVKDRIFGNWKSIQPVADEARALFKEIPKPPTGFATLSALVQHVGGLLERVQRKSRGQRRGQRSAPQLSFSEMQSLRHYVAILDGLCKVVDESCGDRRGGVPKLIEAKRAEVTDFVENFCQELKHRDFLRLSGQEAGDVNMELLRLQRLSMLCQVESKSFTLAPEFRAKHVLVSDAIRCLGPYGKQRDTVVEPILKELVAQANLAFTRYELQMVKQAMGTRTGHWKKCRNGHTYYIGDCGMAMEESRCPECGSGIGGSNHRLRADNTVAHDMDQL